MIKKTIGVLGVLSILMTVPSVSLGVESVTLGPSGDTYTQGIGKLNANDTELDLYKTRGVELTSCIGISEWFCIDSDDGKLYYHDGTAVTEVDAAETDPIYSAWNKDYADLINTPDLTTGTHLHLSPAFGDTTPGFEISGYDVGNSYDFKILAHTGGNSHTQLITGLEDSRITIMPGDPASTSPRIQLTGGNDTAGTGVNRGAISIEVGSTLYDLPTTGIFRVRYKDTSGINVKLQVDTDGTKVNVIDEITAGFGVTVESVVLKDGGITATSDIETTGEIKGRMEYGTDITGNISHNTTDLHNTIYHITATAVITLDAAGDAGYGATVSYRIRDASEVVTVRAATGERINLDGLPLTTGTGITSIGAGKFVTLVSTTDTDNAGTDGWEVWGNNGFESE